MGDGMEKRRNWPKWLQGKHLEGYRDLAFLGYREGRFVLTLENPDERDPKTQLDLAWESIYSYRVTNESFREDCWIGEEEEGWPFYIFHQSPDLDQIKAENQALAGEGIQHFRIVGEDVVDILSSEEPDLSLRKGQDIREFSQVLGLYIQDINGQSRLGYSMSAGGDFYEVPDIIEAQGFYKGSILRFYDYESGEVYQPFPLEKNISYGDPVYIQGVYYFLQGDFNTGYIHLYRYDPDFSLEKLEDFKIEDLNLYNLKVIGEDLHLVSSDEGLEIYYPFRKTVDLATEEVALFIRDGKIYISAWTEEGWDEENDLPGPGYDYYERFIVKDMDGKILEERRGNLFQDKDGTWWLS